MAIKHWTTQHSEVAASVHTLPPYRSAPPFEIGFAVSLRHSEIGFWLFGSPVFAFELSFERTYSRFFAGILGFCAAATCDYLQGVK